MCSSDLAIADAKLSTSDIDAVILATISHPLQTPSAAVLVADRLGLVNPGAFDLSAACSGFPYGVGLADSLVSTGQATNVLVIGVEKLSDWTDPHDRGTAFIFADGAGAIVVSPSDTPGIGPTVWGSNGAEAEAIICLPDWNQLRKQNAESGIDKWPVLHMQGQKVFRWAVSEMAPIARQALDVAGLRPEDIQLDRKSTRLNSSH